LFGGTNTYSYALLNPISLYDPYGLWVPPSLPDWFVNGAAGFGDNLTFGLTRRARDLTGIGASVNVCSKAYGYGEYAGLAASTATGFGAGTKAAARFFSPNNWSNFSHSLIAQSTLKGSRSKFAQWWNRSGNRLNGDYIPTNGGRPDLHDYMDAAASSIGMNASQKAAFVPWSQGRQLLNRIPYTPGAAAYGAGSTALNDATSDCECSN